MIHSLLTQALAEYGATSGMLASAQRRVEGLVSVADEHAAVILAIAVGGVVVWSLLGRRTH